jgi:hypothetical protein
VLDKKMSNPVYLHKKFKEIDEEARICILSWSEIWRKDTLSHEDAYLDTSDYYSLILCYLLGFSIAGG